MYRVQERRMPVGSPVAGSFSMYPRPVTLKSLSMPLSFSASELTEASGPVEKTTGFFGAARSSSSRVWIALLFEPRDEDLAQRDPLAFAHASARVLM